MSFEKIGKIEAISLIITLMINQIILNIPNVILLFSGSSSCINVIYISLIAVIFSFAVYKLFKAFPYKDLIDISDFLGGKFLKTGVGIIYILFFLFLSVLALKYFVNGLKIIYFNNTPITFLLLLFLIPPIVLNKLGIKSITGTNLIFVPITLISLIVLFFAIYSDFVIERIFPILGYGINTTFLSGTTNIFAFSGIAYLYFMPPFLKDHKDFKTISCISTIISAIYLFFSILSLLLSFSSIIITDEISSILLLTRLVQLGKFLQRLDAFFILLWILSIFVLLSISFYYIIQIFSKITVAKKGNELAYATATLVFSTALFLKNIAEIKFVSKVIYRYFSIIIVFGISLIILILANLKKKKFKQKQNLQKL